MKLAFFPIFFLLVLVLPAKGQQSWENQCLDDSNQVQNVLYIGDSHSYMSSDNFSTESGRLPNAIAGVFWERGHSIDMVAACGASTRSWAIGGSTSCGFSEFNSQHPQWLPTHGASTRGSFPPASELFQRERYSQVVINLGDNDFSWSNGRASFDPNAFETNVQNLVSSFEGLEPCDCSFVGPTYHIPGSTYQKSRQVVDQMYNVLRVALEGRCRVVDSREMVVPRSPNDGLHLVNNESRQWGIRLANDLHFMNPTPRSNGGAPVRGLANTEALPRIQ